MWCYTVSPHSPPPAQTSMSGMMDLLDSFSNNLHPLGYHPLRVYLGDLLGWQHSLLSDWLCRLLVAAYTLLPWSRLRLRCSLFASSICLGCQLGGKCCDSTHFLSRGGGHPSCCQSSVSSLATTPFLIQTHNPTVKRIFVWGLDMLRQFDGK